MKKRIIALILALTMSLSMLPVDTFAMETELPEEAESSAVEPAAETEEASEAEEFPVEEIESEPAEEQPAEPQEESAPVEETEDTKAIADPETAEPEETDLLNATVASGTCGKNLKWTLSDTGTLTISGTGKMTDWDDTENIPWYKYQAKIKKIVVDKGVTSIGDEAFDECHNLTSVTLSNSITSIGWCAFSYCDSLSKITIPDSVTDIDWYAFDGCSSLTSIKIPNSVTSMGDGVFSDCSNLKSVTLPSSLTTISDGMFYECSSLTSITLPNSVTTIDDNAFRDCTSLTHMTISSSVTKIGEQVFDGCESLMRIDVDSKNAAYTTEDGMLLNKKKTKLICCPGGKSTAAIPTSVSIIDRHAFAHCFNITDITIPSSVTNIGEGAFWNCYSLTSIAIPGGVTSISEDAFGACHSLTSVAIPSSVTSISICAFYGCENLTSIRIPKSVVKIGWMAFDDCSSLANVYYGGTKADWGKINIDTCNEYLTSAKFTYSAFKDLSACTMSLSTVSYTYNGKAKTPTVTVNSSNGTALKKDIDYTVVYSNNKNAGTATAKVVGIGNYQGTLSKTFSIAKIANSITASNITQTYNTAKKNYSIGATQTGDAKLTYKSSNSKITVNSSGVVTVPAKFMGASTITISAAATTNYTAATKKITVTVNPTKTTLSSVSGGKTSVVVKWKKNTVGTGYEIWLSENADFSAYYRVDTKKNTYTQWTVNKLPAKKKFYVKIRTYKTVDGVRYYSGWSSVKTTKTK